MFTSSSATLYFSLMRICLLVSPQPFSLMRICLLVRQQLLFFRCAFVYWSARNFFFSETSLFTRPFTLLLKSGSSDVSSLRYLVLCDHFILVLWLIFVFNYFFTFTFSFLVTQSRFMLNILLFKFFRDILNFFFPYSCVV